MRKKRMKSEESKKSLYLQFIKDFAEKHKALLVSSDIKEKIYHTNSFFKTPEMIKCLDDFYDQFINIEGLTFDLNVHFSGLDKKTVQEVSKNQFIHTYKEDILKDILAYHQNNKIGHSFIFYNHNFLDKIINMRPCPYCDLQFFARLDYVENKIKFVNQYTNEPLAKNECSIKKDNMIGIVTYDVNLQVPSKKLVFMNSPHSFAPFQRKDYFQCGPGSIKGAIKDSRAYEEMNIGFFNVGGTNPNIFQKNNEIIIAAIYDRSSWFNEEELDNSEYENMIKNGYKNVGKIDTGPWCYAVMDHDLFIHKNEGEVIDFDYEIVDIEGTSITITHDLDARTFDTNNILSIIKVHN